MRSCFAAPYEKATGNTAHVLIGGPPQWLSQIEANPAKPPIDVLATIPDLAIAAGRKGLMEPFSDARLSNLKVIPKPFIDGALARGSDSGWLA